jgi:hypothetical protein
MVRRRLWCSVRSVARKARLFNLSQSEIPILGQLSPGFVDEQTDRPRGIS